MSNRNDASTSTPVGTPRTPDFQILHAKLPSGKWCSCASEMFSDAIITRTICSYCSAPFGFSAPIYRDPLNDGCMTAHLSCAIAHDEVRVWTPEHFAAPWHDAHANINADADASVNAHASADAAERLLTAIIGNAAPCAHLLAFAEFYCDSSVVIMDDSVPIGCFMCDVVISAQEFSALIMRTLSRVESTGACEPEQSRSRSARRDRRRQV